MKKNIRSLRVLFFVCVSLVSTAANAQKTFAETLDVHLNAIRRADLAAFEPTVAESVIHITPAGEQYQSKQKFIKLHEEWFKKTNWEWEGKVVEKQSDKTMGYALIDYSFIQKDETGKILFKIKCYLTLIFKQSGKGWQLVYDQNTIITG
jgi:ketosteroid isomerase-like protein